MSTGKNTVNHANKAIDQASSTSASQTASAAVHSGSGGASDLRSDFGVIVVGGGAAGLVAAIQAARAGVRTLLVEKTGMLGGTTTMAAVTAVSCFNAYRQQVIAGIGWELTCRAVREAGGTIPDFTQVKAKDGRGFAMVNAAIYAAVADEMVLAAGVELRLHTMPAAVRHDGDGWAMDLCGKSGLSTVRGQVLVDATGDANIVTLAGLPVERNPELQPATLVLRLEGYDPATLDFAAIQKAFDAAVATGELRRSDAGWDHGNITNLLRWHGGNCLHVPDVNACTSEQRTQAEIEGRRVMLRLFRFLRRQPGLAELRIAWCAPEIGIRETVTIRGRRKITVADYESGRVWDDAVCYSFYPVDVHTAEGLVFRPLPEGVVPTIPFGALLPESGRNLIVAGRCIAGDKEANSAYRVQSSCMAMGQVAGAAAALAVQRHLEVAEVPLPELRALLRQHGAIVPMTPPGCPPLPTTLVHPLV